MQIATVALTGARLLPWHVSLVTLDLSIRFQAERLVIPASLAATAR